MAARYFIVVGDTTTGGGQAVEGYSGWKVECLDGSSRSVVRVGDQVLCGQCGPTTAIEGYAFAFVRSGLLAYDNCTLACGHKLVSTSQRLFSWDDPAPQGRTQWRGEQLQPIRRFASDEERPARLDDNASHDKTGVTLRIGVFFDGTNNNAANTSMGMACRASSSHAVGDDDVDREAIAAQCKRYMRNDDSSYQNGYTNIWRLYELYRDSAGEGEPPQAGGEYFARIYVDGPGTTAGAKDSLLSQGLGGGKAGVLARVREAISAHLRRSVSAFINDNPGLTIGAIEFDAFGFSRGAAAARHFVNEVNRRQSGLLAPVLQHFQTLLKPGFDWNVDLRVGFVGLFDSVAAIGSLADGLDVRDDDDGGVEMALPQDCARQVVHLIARDEIRANFMLTTSAPHREIALPGVHSDIGGSYHTETEGPLWLTKPVGYDEGPVLPGDVHWSRAGMRRSMAWRQIEPLLKEWQERLDIRDPEQLGIEAWEWIRQVRVPGQTVPQAHRRVYAAVRLRRPIDWRYQLIPLRLMHKLATEAGIAFDFIDEHSPDLALPEELKPISTKLLADERLGDDEERLLRRKYLHLSAHWNSETGKGPVSLDLIYVSRPDPTGRRQVRPNR